MSTAFTVPAFAQIETVVVTAERKAEDIQTVPIAVSAFSGADLAAHQIVQPKDLQFATPSVTYSKTNFTGNNFQIRGIGTQVISGDAEDGVAFNSDDVYYAAGGADTSLFYDLERVEVLRGPQSTLYGRGATGGAVNVFSAKPHLDEFSASFDASYGTYGETEEKGMINVPVIDGELGVRIAADWTHHDGFATNINPTVTDHHPDSRDEWSGRAIVRWEPSDDTTIDVIYSRGQEADTRMRGEKQLCHTDPTGVLGCLPDALLNQPVNPNATFFNIPVSKQATVGAFGATLGAPTAALLGLFDLTQPYVPVAGAVPAGQRNINSDFTPTMENRSNALSAEWKQNITSWLDLNAIGSYSDGHLLSQESYTNSPGAPFSQVALGTSKAVFNAVLANIGGLYGQPNYGNPVTGPYAFVLNPAVAGNPGSETLPTSNFTNNGIIGGSINRYTANPFAYDQSNGNTTQKSGELRLATHFDGPLNGIVGVYYLNTKSLGDYFVGSNTLDYGQTLFGGIGGASPLLGGLCISPTQANGCIYGSPFYDNQSARVSLESKSVYGEVYYDILPDLKLTGGLRYTEDLKESADRITIFDGPEPIGTTDTNAGLNQLAMLHLHDFDPTNGTPPFDTFENTKVKFSKLTGRAVLTWTPKVDWSDQTMFYASYSKGYKAGGSNPGVQGGNPAVPAFYQPEGIDAYEIGTKNTFMDGMFQANLSAWYYNYSGYQVSEVLSNTSVNSNTNAFLNGIEGEFVWLPQDNLQFSLNMDWMETKVGKGYEIDPRNPTGGLPNALLIKDGTLSGTNAQNCVLYYTGSNFATDFATLSAVSGGVFFAPPGGTGALAQYGVAHAAYGICDSAYLGTPTTPGLLTPALNLTHFAVQGAGPAQTTTGASVQLQGRELANSPPFSLNFGAQYTTDIGSGYNLVSRFDYYWQANMWGRIFNDTSDRLNSYGVGNLQFTLNAPDSQWYVQAFARNIFNSTNTTGEYLTSSSSGLWTGVFYGDPRIIGAAVGAHF